MQRYIGEEEGKKRKKKEKGRRKRSRRKNRQKERSIEGSEIFGELTDRSVSDLTITNPFKSVPLRFEHRRGESRRAARDSFARFCAARCRGDRRLTIVSGRDAHLLKIPRTPSHAARFRNVITISLSLLPTIVHRSPTLPFFPLLSSIHLFITAMQQHLFSFFLSLEPIRAGPRTHRNSPLLP